MASNQTRRRAALALALVGTLVEIGLPDATERRAMLALCLEKHAPGEALLDKLASRTQGWSPARLRGLAKAAEFGGHLPARDEEWDALLHRLQSGSTPARKDFL